METARRNNDGVSPIYDSAASKITGYCGLQAVLTIRQRSAAITAQTQ